MLGDPILVRWKRTNVPLEMNGRAILKTFNILLPLGTLCQALGYRGVSSMAKGVYPPSRWQMGHLANCRRVLSVLVNPVNQSRHFEFHIQDEIRLPCYLWHYFPNICDFPANKAWTHHDNVWGVWVGACVAKHGLSRVWSISRGPADLLTSPHCCDNPKNSSKVHYSIPSVEQLAPGAYII